MKGVTLYINENKTQLLAAVDPLLLETSFDPATFTEFVSLSEFGDYTLSAENILSLQEDLLTAKDQHPKGLIEKVVGVVKDIAITITIADDEMSATLTLATHANAITPDVEHVIDLAKKQRITIGLSRKRISNLLQQSVEVEKSIEISTIIAKGLLPRDGRNSFIKPLVPNAFERLLAPQDKGSNKVDMRNLGDIICVKPNEAVAKRIPPTKGRMGKTITGESVSVTPGQYIDIKLGTNTRLSTTNENLIIASVSGQPKFENGLMAVEDAYIAKGVNVSTGDVKYDGAVIVNGDVTENMKIVAKGDVTINGFVESAFIHAEGDIIITEGATGKMHDEDCQLIANGNIYIQHAQGLDIIAGKDLIVAKQLAYSRVKATGNVTVGSVDNPMGNLFASTIHCGKTLQAGSIGAISGSALVLDFSEGYNLLCAHLDSLSSLCKQLSATNTTHENKLSRVESHNLSTSLKNKLHEINSAMDAERVLLLWLQDSQLELQERKRAYEINMQVIAYKELLPGVTVKLNKKVWRGDREYQRCRIALVSGTWQHDPLV